MATWLEKLFGKKRKKRGPNLNPSDLTPAEKAYRAKRAAAARARRRREKGM